MNNLASDERSIHLELAMVSLGVCTTPWLARISTWLARHGSAHGGGGLHTVSVNKASSKVSIQFNCSFLQLIYLLLVTSDRDLLEMSERVKELVQSMESENHQEVLKKGEKIVLKTKEEDVLSIIIVLKLKESDYVTVRVWILCQVAGFQIWIKCITSSHRPSQQVTMGLWQLILKVIYFNKLNI